MKMQFDKVGAVGTVLSALAAAAPCCLPLLASVGTTLGLGVLAPYQGFVVYVLEFFVGLSLVGSFLAFRHHKNRWPFAVGVASSIIIFAAYNIKFSPALIYLGLAGLLGMAVWNTVENRKCATCKPTQIVLQSIITCPSCGFQRTETMPTDACVHFYECPDCKTLLKPRQGDCCVFCSYGSVRCPPIQASGTCKAC